MAKSREISIGIDIGGTFTDIVVYHDGADGPTISWTKASSTPSRPVDGILTAIEKGLFRIGGSPSEIAQFMHGTTVGTNAVLERKGARLGVLMTEGFEDTLEIGRQKRSQLYEIFLEPETPAFLSPRHRRLGARERVSYDGTVLVSLDEEHLETQLKTLKDDRVESLAVCYLFSFQNPAHELRTKEIVRTIWPDLPVSLSHEINPVFREYERLCVTCFDAYLRPVLERYLGELVSSLRESGFKGTVQTMKSRGGLASTEGALRRPVTTMLSGPAAGVIGARFVARSVGISNVITLDMGGTSADVAVVKEGKPLTSTNGRIGRFPLNIPMVDVQTIGAGGGSIAWLDGAKGLRVGPQSSGSDPGPACYAAGGEEPTVTDASLILGYLDPEYFVGGERSLDVGAARRALERLAQRLGMTVSELALGIHRIANARMADAIRLTSIKRGYDTRHFTLMAFGGAGPVNAAPVADDLGIGRCLIPRTAGVLSALGLLVSNVEYDNALTFITPLADLDVALANRVLAQLSEAGLKQMADDGYAEGECVASYSADARYIGQSSELGIPIAMPLSEGDIATIREEFEREHERVYGYAAPNTPIELVNLRTVHIREPSLRLGEALSDGQITRSRDGTRGEPVGFRDCVFPQGEFRTPIHYRAELDLSFRAEGPVIIEQEDTTIVIYPNHTCYLDTLGNIVMERQG